MGTRVSEIEKIMLGLKGMTRAETEAALKPHNARIQFRGFSLRSDILIFIDEHKSWRKTGLVLDFSCAAGTDNTARVFMP